MVAAAGLALKAMGMRGRDKKLKIERKAKEMLNHRLEGTMQEALNTAMMPGLRIALPARGYI